MDRKSFQKWSSALALLASLAVAPVVQAACGYTIQMYTPTAGANYTAPANIVFSADADGTDDGCTVLQVKFYNGTTLLAQVGRNVDGIFTYTWSGVPAGSYTVKAVTGNGAATATANITVSSAQNQAPSVSMAAPTGAPFIAPAAVGLSASASDTDGTISKVDFYQGASLVATDSTPPYTAAFTASTAGTYSFTAKATDNSGASTTSTPVSATVAANSLPTVSLTAPANGATYISPATIPISASASDSDGSIVRVEFRAAGVLLASDTAAPYATSWVTGNIGGTYQITATAVDDKGGTSMAAVNVTFNTPTGSLGANPSPCTILSGDSCQTTVSWTSNDPAAEIWRHFDRYIQTQEGQEDQHVATQVGSGTSGSGAFDIGGSKRNQYFELKSGGAVITSLAPSSNYAPWTTITAPTEGQVFNLPASIAINATGSDTDGSVTKVEFYIDGALFSTDSSSPYAAAWNGATSGTHVLTTRVYDDVGASRQSASVNVTANTTPTIALTAPGTGTVVAAPANILIQATATDADDGVSMVEFYNGAIKLATDTAAPYELQWNGVPSGTYSLTAKAYDNRGGATVSSASTLVVDNLPTVALSAPTAGTVINAPGSYTLTASASDSDGSINRVEFYQGSTLIGTDNTAPYSLLWSNIATGTYSITAKVFDDRGLAKSSTAVSFVVNAVPSVSITAPAMNAVVVAPANVLIQTNATDPDDGIAMVEFYVDGQLRATDIAAPFELQAVNMPAGVYLLTVKAYDTRGGATMSAASTLIVNERPQVQLVSPANGAGITLPAQVTLLANASDSDGTISKVEFYNGSTLLGSATTAPFQVSWAVPASGDYPITAKAFDNQGTATISPVAVLHARNNSWELPYDESATSPDPASDQVAATAAEFRVDETGAATYSIPLFTVPGTAGVVPSLALKYSSQGGYGAEGKGWAIAGLSSITRCRATREAGDFIVNGIPTDGSPAPINFTNSDRYCLDGQRLIPAQSNSGGCPSAGGMTVANLRTEIESFQRVCAYTPSGGTSGPAFFTVERPDGSISWYGDRDNNSTRNRDDGYFNSTTPGKEAFALSWAQTRFQDSTGNYIDFLYIKNPSGAGNGEQLISRVRYTGKTVLPGQSGSALAPFAEVVFNYVTRPEAQWGKGYQSGGLLVQSQRLASVSSSADGMQVRHYQLSYGITASGSGLETLTSIQECRDSSLSVCLPPTTFNWSTARNEFIAGPTWNPDVFGSTTKFNGYKLGDIDGDGRQDLVWLKNGSGGERCGTEYVNVAISELDSSGRQNFRPITSMPNCSPTELSDLGDASWQLFDYTGDGRDDLFVAGAQYWAMYASIGESGQVFDQSVNLIGALAIPVDRSTTTRPQLTDLNGDGLLDVVYPSAGGIYARLMERSGAQWVWGAQRTVVIPMAASRSCSGLLCDLASHKLSPRTGGFQLLDFNADGSSDLLLDASYWWEGNGDVNTRRRFDYLMAFNIASITSTTVTLAKNYEWMTSIYYQETSQLSTLIARAEFADVNADGLTDMVAMGPVTMTVYANTGTGFANYFSDGLPPNSAELVAQDLNGDGRADLAYPRSSDDYYVVRYSLPSGGFSGETLVPGGGATTNCGDDLCFARHTRFFADLDGDGTLDFYRIRWSDDDPHFYFARSASVGQPRDVITRFTNGFGAETDITYAPLTNGAVYRRDAGTRNATNWGRGSPITDLLSPSFVVARASSSSPQVNNPDAKATLYYRYAGAKAQSGGRGFLGFREIATIDVNELGGYIVSSTLYSQNFPFIGMPARTIKRAVSGQSYFVSACLVGQLGNGCYSTPGQYFPVLPGSWFSDKSQLWEADTEIGDAVVGFDPGEQLPIHVRTAGADELLQDPFFGVQTGRTSTTFGYVAYGNVGTTTVDTYDGAGSLESTVITSNVYGSDNPTLWRLGRLTSSVVTHRRPGRPDVVRRTGFAYNMAGAATGLLALERIQPGGALDQDLRKETTYDDYGNRVVSATCTGAVACSTDISFHPAAGTVQRYSRMTYDGRGRFPVTTYEPFWNGSGAVERATQTVLARDIFGAVTQGYDVNGASRVALSGALGRPYYSWVQTIPNARPGQPGGGKESWSTYRWCGSSSNQVICPAGAKFRQKVAAEGEPTSWTYFDLLGRPVMKATQSFNAGTADKDIVATCSEYDAKGKVTRSSNPFFLSGSGDADGLGTIANACSGGAVLWNTTAYDLLGRPIDVTSPDSNAPGVSVVSTDYLANNTYITDARNNVTRQTRNSLGELKQVTDAAGLVTSYSYYADGTLQSVSRDAGRGAIVNSFVYDALGRKIQQDDPDTGVTTFEYNASGELLAQADANGNRVENELDARGRTWRKTVKLADGTIESQSTYTFDTAANGWGQLSSESISGAYVDWRTQAESQPQLRLDFSRTYGFDALGRPSSTTTRIDGVDYSGAIQYDPLGRAWKGMDASGRWAKTAYGERGMATGVCESSVDDGFDACSGESTYQQVLETDAWGHVIKERRGNSAAMDVTRGYYPSTGRIGSICAGGDVTCNLMNEGYAWDAAGNLSTQQKESRYLEYFTYDSLNRLVEAKLAIQNGVTFNRIAQAWKFDALGNICEKVEWDVTSAYEYLGRSGCGLGALPGGGSSNGAGAHQVAQIGTSYFGYDVRGNQDRRTVAGSAGSARLIRYSLDNKGYEIALGNEASPSRRTRFWYGSDGARYKRDDGNGTKTLYLGNVEVVVAGGFTTYRRTVAGVMLQTSTSSAGPAVDYYLFHDQLGNVARITDAQGNPVDNQDYNAFGERRSFVDPMARGQSSSLNLTTRGFTGQEHVDGLSVIHFNGRLYDPTIGRFLQADPFIQAPDNAQSWNAYTYVFNNPLRYTDPTGMLGIDERQWLAAAVAIVAACFGQYYITAHAYAAAFGVAVAGGFVSGAIASQSLKGGLYGAFGAAMSFGFSAGLGYGANIVGQGFTGGLMEVMQGGDFGHGFISAGVSAAVVPKVHGIDNNTLRIAAGAIIGGSLSRATGGKFANGAVSGAIQAAMAGGDRTERDMQTDAAESDGEWIFPEGRSTDLNHYDAVGTNGILGDRKEFVQWVNERKIPGYFNPSHGFAADIVESFSQKFFGGSGDPLAAGFAKGLAGVDHPMTIIAHSQGTLTVANASRYYGLPRGSTFVMRSPALSYFSASSAVRMNGGTMQYVQPWGDVANIYAPTMNPLKWMSGFHDVLCGACTHTANGLR
ncbi:RHS repeat-associated protein [Lysobacter niabensis]|uniref:RHS repeat-associated protein n=1 Tax=Agrilutibacter niabensis TaxID=380628 RepID=A0ABU1VK21_9GAMM|nr:Ig-like domain-containing protein [Lysobacter niabensis]MDR7097829.1 RHS repeat-associated protein [Lysobacter niabensis]